MDSMQFALTIIIVTVLFLSFALALVAIIMGNPTTQGNIVKLWSALTKVLYYHSTSDPRYKSAIQAQSKAAESDSSSR